MVKGQGVIMTGDSEMAAYTGEGIGRFTASGTKWRGAIYYSTSSTGKLSFLNNVVGVYEAEMEAEGNFTDLGMEVGSGFLFSFSD
jgi:hypothetical protein